MSNSLRFRTLLALAGAVATPLAVAGEAITLRIQNGVAIPNGSSSTPAISADGMTVVFRSVADNLTAGPSGGSLFAYDLATRTVTPLAPTANGNIFNPSVSADGRYVAFETNATNLAPLPDSNSTDVLRLDRETGSFVRVSQGFGQTAANAGSDAAAISGDGRLVAFTSLATNLVAGGTAGNRIHVFAMDMETGVVELVSRAPDGTQGNKDSEALEPFAVSGDGNRIVFATGAENIAPVFLGNVSDVLVRTRDPQTGAYTFENVNRSAAGVLGSRSSSRGAISANGRWVVFRSLAPELVPGGSPSGLFRRDLETGTVAAVPLPAGYGTCDRARIGDFGDVMMKCAPLSPATAQQLFLARADGSAPKLLSRNTAGFPGNQSSGQSFAMDPSATLFAFESAASDLIPVDGNVAGDAFLVGDAALLDGLHRDGFED